MGGGPASLPGGAACLPELERAVRSAAHLLPAQGPISVFIHHNPLHALEHLPFETAVLESARLLGREPFLAEARYREELRRGRIHEADLDAELAAELGPPAGSIEGGHPPRGDERVAGDITRRELRRRLLIHGLPEVEGAALAWLLSETRVLSALGEDLPADAREALGDARPREEAARVRALWCACRRAAERARVQPADPAPPPSPSPSSRSPSSRSPSPRHRDRLLDSFGIDIDEWVHPILIRVTSAYLDQGLADWSMPGRERGLFACFIDLYRRRAARLCCPFGPELRREVEREARDSQDAWSSLAGSLSRLGVPPAEWDAFLAAEALALGGFAGMVHQFEVRPDRVPASAVPARLVDFLAVRMVLVRAGLAHAAGRIGFGGDLSAMRTWLSDRSPARAAPSLDQRAWPLFHAAQLCGLDGLAVDDLDAAAVTALAAELCAFDGAARRRMFHRAYERHLRRRFFDAVVQHRGGTPAAPAFQAVFCLDDREESMRRHLEEVDPEVETFGTAGFFGVAMYYRGATDAHPRPLCPAAIQPRHYVAEVKGPGPRRRREAWRPGWERLGALVDKNVHLGSRHAGRGAVLMATLGVLWALPLVLRVVFPWLSQIAVRLYGAVSGASRGRLALAQSGAGPAPPVGQHAGFTREEMAEIVGGQLSAMGLGARLARLVLVLGHGSTSLNNPHESAHDCGACGGGRGGPNARAFAQMANDPDVRALLARRGVVIPPETWFVGGQRNTATSDVELFDEDTAPPPVVALLARARASLDEARRREAHERCRRFESAPGWLRPFAALLHVQSRATDLAQPRPEYGHATNAVCVIGRRARTRGLFLDRRAFLVSYDPDGDADGAVLGPLLDAVVPVMAGISLEYFFGTVDPVGYGSGTKLPHNVTGLFGVMDGAQSDLRTGLPWQMLEIHEPVRLSIIVEAGVQVLRRLVDASDPLRRLVHHRWIFLAALDPDAGTLDEIDDGATRRHQVEHALRHLRGPSQEHYRGRRGHLPFVAVGSGSEAAP